MSEIEEYLDYVDSANFGIYKMPLRDGDASALLPLLTAIIAIDPDAQVTDTWEESGAKIEWKRKLRPEEIAKRERDEREYEAKRNAENYANERREYERLKAKFGE